MKKNGRKIISFMFIVLNVIFPVFDVFSEGVMVSEKIPEIYIRAINPGYVVDGKNNVGEMIEIARKNSDAPISLAGTTVGYTNSSGNNTVLYEFPENSWMAGEAILLRLASSPDSGLASVNYTKTLAFKGELDLNVNGETVDKVCWTGKTGCYKDFKSANPTTLVRNLETGDFMHQTEYIPQFIESNYYVIGEGMGEAEFPAESQCKGLEFSEILSYYETFKTEQFIEFYNPRSEQVLLDGCKIKYKNKFYELEGIVKPEEYFVYYPKGFSLTKNPTNMNMIELVDVDGKVVDKMTYPNGQRKGTAYAMIGYDEEGEEIWRVTYAPTPGSPNNYQEFKTCEEGKVINKVTGNCVKVTGVTEKVCKEGQYLNILTGRCKKYEEAKAKTCKKGYYYNEETGRCRKIKENTGADYSLTPENYEEKSSFIALYVVLGVLGVGVIYVIYEFRKEILKLFRKVFRRFR